MIMMIRFVIIIIVIIRCDFYIVLKSKINYKNNFPTKK